MFETTDKLHSFDLTNGATNSVHPKKTREIGETIMILNGDSMGIPGKKSFHGSGTVWASEVARSKPHPLGMMESFSWGHRF